MTVKILFEILLKKSKKKLNRKLKEKDKWIYYDEYGWGNF